MAQQVRGKIKTSERLAETISLMKPTTGLANNKSPLVTEKPAAENEKLIFHQGGKFLTSQPTGSATDLAGH